MTADCASTPTSVGHVDAHDVDHKDEVSRQPDSERKDAADISAATASDAGDRSDDEDISDADSDADSDSVPTGGETPRPVRQRHLLLCIV